MSALPARGGRKVFDECLVENAFGEAGALA